MTLVADLFLKLQTAKVLLRLMSIEPRFRTPFDSQHVKGSQTLPKSERQYFYHNFLHSYLKLSSEISLLIICEMLGLFVTTLTGDDKYCLRNNEYLPQPIQMQLSKKKNTFSQFFAKFVNFTSNF